MTMVKKEVAQKTSTLESKRVEVVAVREIEVGDLGAARCAGICAALKL
ncbi:hypothetical protein [Pendulispora albinea]|uniref:Uncharacterized protein n=1 Tax=Pendulispora albinea TaxID=2741071 RepID=A0ABZ2LTE3_9BACT